MEPGIAFWGSPKGTRELVIFGVDAIKPFLEVGIVSANGEELVHKVDVKLERCCLCHEIGVTLRYIAILHYFPLIIDLNRLLRNGPLIKYGNKKYARIGIMPIYGDADSTKWFEVEPNTTFHLINSFKDGHEYVGDVVGLQSARFNNSRTWRWSERIQVVLSLIEHANWRV
ncbi:9-cis-epoxycarotenoid dioxygenase NCED1, chloroplastic-like [Abrus precatorius]|uniref:9-cis-epoxycarotenoid dioxygenase NCED1, chloroplastic-like n=1 Tax=Abrus precatorius TaxID=3816 RepID=A0A8B8LLP7_ABRPR|nr:9-cis-epoxycarotenoid dioxygenase NCED1, chloroplastic-like [Abrus precatorius]